MFNRTSNEHQESAANQSSGSRLPAAPAGTSADAGQNSRASANHQQADNELEPTPFRQDDALRLSSSNLQAMADRPFMVVSSSQHVPQGFSAPAQNPILQHHAASGVQPSWMATVDRIIGNRSQETRVEQPSSSNDLAAQGVFAHSIGNQVPAARRDQQLSIEAPVDASSERAKARFRPYQRDQWEQQYKELLRFRQKHGHCHIPHTYEENPALSRWAKRQRYQYKRKLEHKQSAMSDARQQKLDEVGFVWDLQTMVWQERFNELVSYKTRNGNCNVPCRYDENPTLGMWVKCQRRQYKLFQKGELSRLTPERFQLLTNLGFTWDPQGDSSNKGSKSASQR